MKKFNIKSIELITEKGIFTFAPHFNSTADPYQALCMFESNNWRQLGNAGFEYKVCLSWDDETESISTFSGINASADLAEFLEPENNN